MRRWIIAATLVVVSVVAGPGVGTAAAAPLPSSMAAIGDSITRAFDVCYWYGNHRRIRGAPAARAGTA